MSDEEDLDDEAMMSLDAGLAALFSEQKKKMEAKREETVKVTKEKTLILDFKMKVLTLPGTGSDWLGKALQYNRGLAAARWAYLWTAGGLLQMQSFSERFIQHCFDFDLVVSQKAVKN